MLCYLEGSEAALDGILRPGNAGSNTGADQVAAIEAGLEQLPPSLAEGEVLVRGDSAACVHAVVDFCREGGIRFSVGHDITAPVREAIAKVPDSAWVGAISQDGVPVAEHPTRPREAYVAELTEHLDLSAWPQGSRLICRRERAHPGAQLSLVDTDGWRHTCFLTDQEGEDIAELDRDHRAHAHVEQRIEDAKALGLAKLPFRSFAMNEAWMQLVLAAQDIVGFAKALTLEGDLAKAKPQTLRYRLLHQAGRLARSGRRTRLRLARHWPWARTWWRPAAGSTPCPFRRGEPAVHRLEHGAAVSLAAAWIYSTSPRSPPNRPKAVPRNPLAVTHGADTVCHHRRTRSRSPRRAYRKIWAKRTRKKPASTGSNLPDDSRGSTKACVPAGQTGPSPVSNWIVMFLPASE